MSASPHTVTATGNVVVVSQVRHNVAPVFPPPPPPPGTRPVNPADNTCNFRKQQPVIGVVQIIVALLTFVFGIIIVRGKRQDKLAVDCGTFVWGPLTSFIAGSLTVATGTSLNCTQVKYAVTFNAFAAVVSLAATIIYILDLTRRDPFPGFWNQDPDLITGLTGGSFVLFFLEFGLSIIIALSRCRDTSYTNTQQPLIFTNQFYENSSVTMENPPSYLPPPYEKPPEYSRIFSSTVTPSTSSRPDDEN